MAGRAAVPPDAVASCLISASPEPAGPRQPGDALPQCRAPMGCPSPTFPAGEVRCCGLCPPTCVDTEWAWHSPTQSSPWTTELMVLLQEPPRPPLGTICAKTCWLFFTWVGMKGVSPLVFRSMKERLETQSCSDVVDGAVVPTCSFPADVGSCLSPSLWLLSS